MTKHYYEIVITYNRNETSRYSISGHIVKAFNKEDALRIREKHGISLPMNSTEIRTIRCHKLDLRHSDVKAVLERRRKHLHGSIWYEDENGNLQTEI